MIHTREVMVDGKKYSVTQFSASKGMKLLTRLVKILGEPMASFFSNPDAEQEIAFQAALAALSDKLDEDVVLNTVKELIDSLSDAEGSIQFDTYFAGQFGHLFKVLGKILEVQYGDFFGVLVAKGSEAQAAKKVMTRTSTLAGLST